LRPGGAALLAAILLISALPSAAGGAEPEFHIEQVASGYTRPLYVTAGHKSNFLYVVVERGVINVLTRTGVGKPWAKAGTFLDLRSKVAGPYYSRGLLGMAFHPNYAENGRFYVFYTRKSSAADENGDIVIAEYRRRTNKRARPGSARTVLVIEHPTTNHMGGWLGFGPDGYMYATVGDATIDGVPQDLDSQLGKVLRFNPRKAAGVDGFVPPDNPFATGPGDDLVWAYGLRNPWRASFDRATGDLWLSDPGDVSWEEVDRFAPGSSGSGRNLGWATCEGSHGPSGAGWGAAAMRLAEFGCAGARVRPSRWAVLGHRWLRLPRGSVADPHRPLFLRRLLHWRDLERSQ